jgi:ferric-dicitrate binding protein FerR (iron transport regulator)
MSEQDYIQKWLTGTLTEHERNQFAQTDTFQSLARMDRALKQFQPPPFDSQAAYAKIKSRTSRNRQLRFVDWRMVYRVAAVLLIGAVIFYFMKKPDAHSQTFVATQAGETRVITLPDNSTVTLNAASSLSYTKAAWEQERKIELEGEAYFDVEKGKSFTVLTTHGQVTVLGTRFSVKDRPGFYDVLCYEGKVEVKGKGEPVQLTPQGYYREAQDTITHDVFITETKPAWLNRESSFQQVPVMEVLRELERQYGVAVRVTQVDTLQYFTGKFPHGDLTTALQTIAIPLNLSYRVHDKEIHLFANEP